VSVFIVVGVILSGAALGYWIVRKFVLSEDGTVDAGIAQFVKWAIRFTGVVFILQVWSMSSEVVTVFIFVTAGKSYPSCRQGRQQNKDYYSTYHNLPVRKFSKKDWDNFTRESTNTALTEWASTPEVAKWIADNAHRMRLDQGSSSGDTMESSSGSSEETVLENGSGLSFFKWL
ncbi:hypothetical protein B296_00034552, partial [Ensete ventricosum]